MNLMFHLMIITCALLACLSFLVHAFIFLYEKKEGAVSRTHNSSFIYNRLSIQEQSTCTLHIRNIIYECTRDARVDAIILKHILCAHVVVMFLSAYLHTIIDQDTDQNLTKTWFVKCKKMIKLETCKGIMNLGFCKSLLHIKSRLKRF